MELTQVRLIVTDFTHCYRFYRDVLGLTPQVDDENGPYAKFELDRGNAAIALHDSADLEKVLPMLELTVGDRALVVLKVDDVDQSFHTFRKRGAEVVREPATAWNRLRVAYLRDPEGNLIELQEWLDA